MTDLKDKKLYLVDGSGFIFRAFHALPPLTRSDGTPVNAVLGFTNMLMKLLVDIHAHYLAVIFDAQRVTFRNEIYPLYKAHRPPAPETLIPQFSIVREACQAFNVPALELPGYEADDIIATLAAQASARGMHTTIVSSDKDLMQLINDQVSMFDAMKNKSIGVEQVLEKFGVNPERVIDVQALMGDATDNVPGVPGIGPKTAAELIQQFGDLESLLAQAHTIKQPKRRDSLLAHASDARMSYQLVSLKSDVPLDANIDDLHVRTPESHVLKSFLETQGFHSIIKRMQHLGDIAHDDRAPLLPAEPAIKTDYQLVQDIASLEQWIARAWTAGQVAFDTETTSLDAHTADLVGISLSITPGQACYIPLGHRSPAGDLLNPAPPCVQIPLERALAMIKPLLEHPGVLKIGQNIKYDALIMARYGVTLGPYDDTMVMSYTLDGGQHRHNMDELALRHLGISTITFSDVVGTGKNAKRFDEILLEDACNYAAQDADITLRLYQALKPRLQTQSCNTIYYTIDRPLIPVLTKMEQNGIMVDVTQLQRLSADLTQRLQQLEQDIWLMAGAEFNIASPKQLGEILFDRLGMPGGKKGANKAYSTGADVLEKLAGEGFEIAEKLLIWRQLAKLKSTYADTLPQQIHPQTGRVHTSYHMAGTLTGRLSSSDPNLQNIPVRTEEGRKIRKAFIPQPGWKLVSFDYSQIELRLLADVADITQLKKAFHQGVDIHALTASEVFGVPLDQMTPALRSRAKAINFGIIYGISAFGLARQLDISRSDAARYIAAYLEHYPGIARFMEDMKAFAAQHGYVCTLLGRKCFIVDIHSKNPAIRAFAERQAVNAPLQGGNADIIKKAMHRIDVALSASPLQARMLLQVHDELIFEVPENEVAPTIALIQPMMEAVVHLSVPLVVDAHVGDNWAQAK